jgi:hypothetical protein
VAQTGAAKADVASEAKDGDLFPLADDLDRKEKIEADQGSSNGVRLLTRSLRDGDSRQQADGE